MAEHTESGKAQSQDVPQQIDVDPGVILERLDSWVDGGIRLLPNILLALVVLVAFYGIGVLTRRLILRQSHSRGRENLGEVLGGFVKWALVLLGFLLAATIVIPSLKPGDLIAGLGVSSVAIGFAFKDILQNWLAGLLILLRQPFNVKDQIEVNGHEGTVERIETRATIIKTHDGRRIVIPNSDIYTNAVLVKTAYEYRRSQYDIGIGYEDDIDQACELLKDAVTRLEGVESEPEVQALPWDLAASWVTIRVRWWTGSQQSDVTRIRAAVVRTIKLTLEQADVDMPGETRLCLFHDQTGSAEGDRKVPPADQLPAEKPSADVQPKAE
ncbi:mechanosensitive ion channel family protein [Oceanisphaera arctica]|uniref:Small-conductance mechanosensitive channel n=1 Tax=Oceanisphaera arctica TaxID=641510 RepID=A0A2P5TMH4_9GAMM|nr:mechanosensitive ion channel family protein [Oceanisphaera arctica]PPL16640.1 mechanosensitive ion channel protein MscS [Oceanisphaera arctica]GHA21171.1 transporter [Oceanisphaera arctica]